MNAAEIIECMQNTDLPNCGVGRMNVARQAAAYQGEPLQPGESLACFAFVGAGAGGCALRAVLQEDGSVARMDRDGNTVPTCGLVRNNVSDTLASIGALGTLFDKL